MLAIIGFIALLGLGLFLVFVTGMMFFGGSLFGGAGLETLFSAALAAAVLWASFHFAPFTVAFVG